jgi:single-strand DNA-binding protein
MLIGNAGKDAELRYLANGTPQAKFSLAVNRNFKGADGEWKEETEWFNIVVWAALAERISQNITKGKQLYVEGRLSTRSWDDDQGVKHYMTEVVAQDLKILERREVARRVAAAMILGRCQRARVAIPALAAAVPQQAATTSTSTTSLSNNRRSSATTRSFRRRTNPSGRN